VVLGVLGGSGLCGVCIVKLTHYSLGSSLEAAPSAC